MAIKVYKPYTKSRRAMQTLSYEEITKATPEKSLLLTKKHTGGRNNQGVITCRHHGGGNKNRYRIVDFRRNKDEIPGTVSAIEYDPNRTAFLALITYADGEKRYIMVPSSTTSSLSQAKADRCAALPVPWLRSLASMANTPSFALPLVKSEKS